MGLHKLTAGDGYTNLTAADLDPRFVALPDGLDPADALAAHGPELIGTAIANRTPLGDTMLEHTLRTAGQWSDPAVRQNIVEQAAAVLAARGADTWTDTITRLNRRLHLSPGLLEHRTVEASIARDRDPIDYAQARIRETQDRARAGAPVPSTTTARRRAHKPAAKPALTTRAPEAPAQSADDDVPRR